MIAAKLTHYGGAEQIKLVNTPTPTREQGSALVQVVASTINPVDIKTMTPHTIQKIQHFPATLGWDIAGVIIEADQGSSFKIGDRVIGMNPPNNNGEGSWQQIAVIPGKQLVLLPETIDLSLAVTLPLAGLTTLQALRRLALDKEKTLLVTGAAGSVGRLAVQLAKLKGLEVSGLVRQPSQKEIVSTLGANHVYSDGDWLPEFDTIFDTAGIVHQPEILKEGGQFVTVSDEQISFEVQNKATFAVHNYVKSNKEELKELVHLVSQGALQLKVAESYSFHAIRKAIQTFNTGGHNGKITLLF